jgi:GT2 family glycosyltransferase
VAQIDPSGVSFVIATRDRRDVLLQTLEHVWNCGLHRGQMEVFVVDNASTDGTASVVAERFPQVHLMALNENRGSCAKGLAVEQTRFPYVMFLDDDSWPLEDSVSKMISRFEATPSLAAAGFMAHLVDGRMECSALPGVFIGCGVGFRRDVLLRVGGLDTWFFMQAEEYDLSFRLANAGYQVRVFDDLHVRHLKTPQARYRGTTAYYDVRNNTVVACRYLPASWLRVYLADWIRRYAWLSRSGGNLRAFARGLAAGLRRGGRDRLSGRYDLLSSRALEGFFRIEEIESRMRSLHATGVRRILLADLGKNVLAFWRGAKAAGINPAAIVDDRFALPAGRRYRGTPILSTAEALAREVDAVVISNTSYAHAAERARQIRTLTGRPVHDWFGRPA